MKRIMILVEITYPADDERDLAALTGVAAGSVQAGVQDRGGSLAHVQILSAAVDPGPEPRLEGVMPQPVPDPSEDDRG